jgi:hypothetical protein
MLMELVEMELLGAVVLLEEVVENGFGVFRNSLEGGMLT